MNSGIVLDLDNIRHRYPTGGIPKGQLITWMGRSRTYDDFGPKSNIMLHLIKQAIDRGDKVLFLNLEGSIDPEWLANLGINSKEK